jgi:hypothetical protein
LKKINEVNTRYLSNKDKKKFKKERTLILSNPNLKNELDTLANKNIKLSNSIETMSEIIFTKESELNRWKKNNNNLTFLELNNLYSKIPVFSKSNTNLKKKLKNKNFISNRYYSTLNRSKAMHNSIEQSIDKTDILNKEIYYKNFIEGETLNKKYIINSNIYLDLQRILNSETLDEINNDILIININNTTLEIDENNVKNVKITVKLESISNTKYKPLKIGVNQQFGVFDL